MNNTCSIRITAAAGTNLARAFLFTNFIIIVKKTRFTIGVPTFIPHRGLLDHPWRHCPRFFTADVMYRHCFKPVVADRSLKPAKHRWLELAFTITNYHNTVWAYIYCALSFNILKNINIVIFRITQTGIQFSYVTHLYAIKN